MNQIPRTSEILAQLTHSVNYDRLPAEVVQRAKELIVDSIACMLGGVKPEQGSKMIALYSGMGGVPDAQVYGTDRRLPLLNAVCVNSYLATVLDFDDTYDGHPGSTVVPVALTVGEWINASGVEIIEAVVAGYEVGIRVSNGIKPTPERTRKVRGINTWQIFCAAATAARLLRLSPEETAHALCHAALHASVPSLRKWGFIDGRIQWLKNNFGWTSYGGVLSCLLAKEGFMSDLTIFDGEDGFWIMASSDRCDYDALREPLTSYHLMKVHTKPYPACRHIHPTLDAVSEIMASSMLNPAEVHKIEVHTFYEVVENYGFLPTIPFDACFSAPYLVGLLVHGVTPGPDWADPVLLRDEGILNTARKVELIDWDEASSLYPLVNRELISRVKVSMRSGREFERTVRIPRGDPRRPMAEEELRNKLRVIAEPILGARRVNAVYSQVMALERLEQMREFGLGSP
jgi:2-methylcitrate dehydratase PrpD